jgi:N-acetylglutamate synthase-like GNAT family acetyltransferase
MKLRMATSEDVEPISTFLDTYHKDFFTPLMRVRRDITGVGDPKYGTTRKPLKVALAEMDDTIIGVVFVTGSGSCYQLLVRDDMRHLGVGTALLQFTQPTKIRCKIDIKAGNPIEFYKKNGYTKVQSTFDGDIALDGKKSNIIILEK